MTNFEKIKFLLDMGVYKGVEVKTDTVLDFTFLISHGNFLEDDCGLMVDYDKIQDLNITSITPIPNPPKLLPVGTKVRVFEDWISKQQEGTTSLQQEVTYSVLQVCDIDYRYGIRYNEGQCERVPSRAVYPVWEDSKQV